LHKPTIDLTAFNDFEAASRAVLAYLHQRLGFSLWMMTRTEGADWIVLQAEDHGYNVKDGTVFRWADSFCSQMVLGRGPRVAPRAQDTPVYAAARISQQVPIGAYIGVPLARKDGSLFGTLCAIDPRPQQDSIRDDLPLIELLARLLGAVLDSKLKEMEQTRLLERTQQEALTDALTGLLNRHGWEKTITTEEVRARRYGSPACVLIVDLDDLKQINDVRGHAQGDALIRSAADCIRSAVRQSDTVARIGGDEFAILSIECDTAGSEAMLNNVVGALSFKGINASVGKASRDPRLGLIEAIAEADRAMYAAKAQRRALQRARLTSRNQGLRAR
jgi:diguanylate cyclase